MRHHNSKAVYGGDQDPSMIIWGNTAFSIDYRKRLFFELCSADNGSTIVLYGKIQAWLTHLINSGVGNRKIRLKSIALVMNNNL